MSVTETDLLLLLLTFEDEDEDAVCEAVLERDEDLREYKRQCWETLPPRPNILDWPTDRFYAFFRFNKEDFPTIIRELEIPDPVIAKNGSKMDATLSFALLCYRLSFPSTWERVSYVFGVRQATARAIFGTVLNLLYERWRDLVTMVDFRRVGASLPLFDERTQAYGAGLPVDRIWGFLDGTDLAISRPTHNQREAYSGHKHRHVLKFQGVTTPDGILVQMFGPVEGCRHDATLLADSHLVEQLRAFMTAHFGPAIADWYFLYADKGYGITDVIQTPIRGVEAQNPAAVAANRLMSGVRIAVEHSFRKFKSLWAFQNYYMDCKLELSAVGRFYIVCVLLTNVHTTLYESQVGRAYHCAPPSLHEYLHGIFNPARNAATFALYVPIYPIGALGAAVPDIADYDVGRPVALHERAAEV